MALIELEAALRALDDLQAESVCESDDWEEGVECAYDRISMQEKVYAVPVIHAHLIYHDDEFGGRVAECTNCHTQGMLYGNYCVFCGAKLDGKDEA